MYYYTFSEIKEEGEEEGGGGGGGGEVDTKSSITPKSSHVSFQAFVKNIVSLILQSKSSHAGSTTPQFPLQDEHVRIWLCTPVTRKGRSSVIVQKEE